MNFYDRIFKTHEQEEELQRRRIRRVGFGLCELCSLKEEKEERNE